MTFELPADIAALSDSELASLREAAVAAATEIGNAESFSASDAENLTKLAEAVDAIDAQLAANAAADAELATKRDELMAKFAAPAVEATEDVDAVEVEPVVEAEPVVATAVSPKASLARSIVAKAAAKPSVVAPVASDTKPKLIVAAAADVPGLAMGKMEGLDALIPGIVARWNGYERKMPQGTPRIKHGLGSIEVPFAEGLIADGRNDQDVMNLARSEARLPGGSLVAAGGWCAPSETMYDVCSAGELTGLYSLPEVGAPRGGIRYTRALDYQTIFAQIQALTLCATEAELVAEPPLEKDCIEVDCPTFTEVRMDACWLCIKTALLQNRAYPEYVREFLRTAVIAHQNLMDTRTINAVVTLLGAATVIPASFGTIAQLLAAIDLAATDFRYRHSLPLEATLEVVLPEWIIPALRDDFVRRQFNLADDLTRAQVNAWFGVRNVNVQWVRNWQATGFGQVANATAYPTTAQFMLYEAGSYVRLREDIINVQTVSDATLLTTNRQLGLFMEEGWAVAPMCKDGRLYTFSVCNSGSTGGPIVAPPGVFVCGQA